MNFCRHFPGPPLSAFVEWLWYYDDLFMDHDREHVLPDATFELVINLENRPRKLFTSEESQGYRAFRRAWLSGAHSSYLVIDVLNGASMMGAHFRAGGVAALLCFPADELAGRVVELDEVWGLEAWVWRDRLMAAPDPKAKFKILESWLLERLKAPEPSNISARRVISALSQFNQQVEFPHISSTAESLNISHKHLIREFRKVTGLTPKLYCRIQRFQRVLSEINRRKEIEWASIAVGCGYFDQAHFIRDFTAFSGINPSAYIRHRLDYPGFIRAADEG